jgi:hypothetical protein
MSDDDAAPDGPAMPLADWRRPSQEQRIDAVPAHLREWLAATAERVAATFTLAAPLALGPRRHGPAPAPHRPAVACSRP